MQQNKNSQCVLVLLFLLWSLFVSADELDVCELTEEVKEVAYNNTPQDTVKYLETKGDLSSCEYSLIHLLDIYFGIDSVFSEKERLKNIDSNDPSLLFSSFLVDSDKNIDVSDLGMFSELQKNQLLSMHLLRNFSEKSSDELITKMQSLTLDPTSSYIVFNAKKLSQVFDVSGEVKEGGDICSLVYTMGREMINDYQCFYFNEAIKAFNNIDKSKDFKDISEEDIDSAYAYIIDYYKKRIGNVIDVKFDFLERCESYNKNFNIYKRCLSLASDIHLRCDFSFYGLAKWNRSGIYKKCFESYLFDGWE